jgi:hypothetical protein
MKFRCSLMSLSIAAALAAAAPAGAAVALAAPEDLDIAMKRVEESVVPRDEFLAQADDVRKRADEVRAKADEVRARADEARARAEEARKRADEARAKADDVRARADEARARAEDARKRIDTHREEIHLSMADVGTAVSSAVHAAVDAASSAFAYSFTGTVKPIKNAPYSGEVVNEKIRTLSDGNQLIRKTSNRVWRDSAGATRQEIYDANGQLKTVHIRDAEGSRYILSPAKKSAIKISSPKRWIEKTSSADGRDGKKVVVNTNTNVVVKRGGEGQNVVIKHVEGPGKEKSEEVRIIVNSGDGMDLSALGALGELGNLGELGKLSELGKLGELGDLGELGESFAFAGDAFAQAWRSGEPIWVGKDKSYEKTATNLGTKNFDGVVAEGKGKSYTIPAGKIGNQKPIVVSSESWYAPDLQITVYSKHSDPRVGDTIYRVANLKRGEPSADLFRVPSDYTVKDPLANLSGKIRIEREEKRSKGEKSEKLDR